MDMEKKWKLQEDIRTTAVFGLLFGGLFVTGYLLHLVAELIHFSCTL